MALYLVTGGAGFVGSNLVARFMDDGHRVVVSDWLGQDERWRNLRKHPPEDVIRPDRLFDWLDAHAREVDAVVHMGAISATTETNIDALVENNIRLSNDLWDWCTAQQKSFLYASSAATYGDGSGGFDDSETTPEALEQLRPLNAYGWSKQVVDCRIARILRAGGARPPQWVGFKFFNIYGPNEYHKGAMRSVIAKNVSVITHGAPIKLFKSHHPDYADGGQLRDFVYVDDCADIISWFLQRPDRSGLFNLGTGQARSWLDLAKATFDALGQKLQVTFIDIPPEVRLKYQYFTQAEMRKLRSIGYNAPFISLEDGIRAYVGRYLTRADPYR